MIQNEREKTGKKNKEIKQCELWVKFKMPSIHRIEVSEVRVLEKYLKKYDQNISKLDENYTPIYIRIPINPKHNKTTSRRIIRQ